MRNSRCKYSQLHWCPHTHPPTVWLHVYRAIYSNLSVCVRSDKCPCPVWTQLYRHERRRRKSCNCPRVVASVIKRYGKTERERERERETYFIKWECVNQRVCHLISGVREDVCRSSHSLYGYDKAAREYFTTDQHNFHSCLERLSTCILFLSKALRPTIERVEDQTFSHQL